MIPTVTVRSTFSEANPRSTGSVEFLFFRQDAMKRRLNAFETLLSNRKKSCSDGARMLGEHVGRVFERMSPR